jgi:hypothetical protein
VAQEISRAYNPEKKELTVTYPEGSVCYVSKKSDDLVKIPEKIEHEGTHWKQVSTGPSNPDGSRPATFKKVFPGANFDCDPKKGGCGEGSAGYRGQGKYECLNPECAITRQEEARTDRCRCGHTYKAWAWFDPSGCSQCNRSFVD